MTDLMINEVGASEFLAALERGVAAELYAGVAGGLVIVEPGPDDPTPGDLAKRLLAAVPLILVVVGSDNDGSDKAGWSDLADVVVGEGASELEDVIQTYRTSPRAAVALALLLRSQPLVDRGAGVVAESAVYSMLLAGPEFRAWRASHAVRPPHPDDVKPRVVVRRSESDPESTVLELTLTRAHRSNAVDARMRDELLAVLDVARWDDTISEVSVRAQGANFCAGGDLDEFGSFGDAATAHIVRLHRHIGWSIASIPARVTMHVHGACIGSGMEIPAFADHVIGVPGSVFSLPEVGMGLVPGAGGTWSVTARIGRHRTAWLALTRRRIDVDKALNWGLVDEIAAATGPAS